MTNRVAAIITSYNMPERADALAEHIINEIKWPCDLILLDNGSDLVPPAKHTTVTLPENVQCTRGWLAGMDHADHLQSWKHGGEPYLAYWVFTTSVEFPKGSGDVLTPMAQFMVDTPDAVIVLPALTEDSDLEAWAHIHRTRGGDKPRRVNHVDNLATLYRADFLNEIGRFDRDLMYGWGPHEESCYKARKANKSIWVDERVRIKKLSGVGYHMDRMNMTREERSKLAMECVRDVFIPRYGENWPTVVNESFSRPEWR